MANKALIAGIIILIIVAGAAAYYFMGKGGGEEYSPTTTTSGTTTTTQKKVLRVGTSPDFPPFEYIAENGSIVGFDIDLVRHLAKMIGYDDIEIVSIDFDGLIPALQQGQIDVIAAGMTITAERAQQVDFTIPYWQADQAILVKEDSSVKPASAEELEGLTVGVQQGTTAQSYLEGLVDNGTNIDIKVYTSYVLAVQDLVNGRVDAVVVDKPVAQTFEKTYPVVISGVIETGEKYGLAVQKGNTELLNALNNALQEFMNSPEWDQLIQKYFG